LKNIIAGDNLQNLDRTIRELMGEKLSGAAEDGARELRAGQYLSDLAKVGQEGGSASIIDDV